MTDRLIVPLVSSAKLLGLTPKAVSVLSLLTAVTAALSFYGASEIPLLYVAGSLLVGFTGILDLVDGKLARELDVASAAGDFLDHVFDRYADIVIIAGLAAGTARYSLGFLAITGVLMTSYVGTQAQAVDLDRVYGGLVARADRLTLIGVVTIVTPFLEVSPLGLSPVGWLLVALAVVGHLTALQRFYFSMRALS